VRRSQQNKLYKWKGGLSKEEKEEKQKREELESLRTNSRRELHPREPRAKLRCTDVGSF
jgi:hypothetical protein